MDLKAMIETRMKNTQAEHGKVSQMIHQAEAQLTALTTKRVELASVYNADKELLDQFTKSTPIPEETVKPEVKVKKTK